MSENIMDLFIEHPTSAVLIVTAVIILFTIVLKIIISKNINKTFTDVNQMITGNPEIKEGIKSVGFIKSFEQTGTYINEQPQLNIILDIIDENQQLFTANTLSLVNLTELHTLSIGSPQAVIYSKDRQTVQLDLNPNLAELQEVIDKYDTSQPGSIDYETLKLLNKDGVNELALIKDLKIKDKILSNGKRELDLTIEITPKHSGQSQLFKRDIYLLPDEIKKLVIGQFIEITYLPNRPEVFVIRKKL